MSLIVILSIDFSNNNSLNANAIANFVVALLMLPAPLLYLYILPSLGDFCKFKGILIKDWSISSVMARYWKMQSWIAGKEKSS